MSMRNKRGQVTIFVIIAIIIIALAVLVYFFYPQIRTTLGFESKNPNQFMQSCLEDEIVNNVAVLSVQGGSINPGHYIVYNDEKVEYLCYTSEYYKTCVMQQPMLKSSIEEEIKNAVSSKALECLRDLEASYGAKGYNVNRGGNDFIVELLPNKILLTFNSSLTLAKDSSDRYDAIRVAVDNNLYELVSIANSILNMEAHYGDAETTTYMNYYRDLKVEKKKQSDGSTIYILTESSSGNKFQFASRSVAWPPGYGVDEVVMTGYVGEV